MNRITVTFTECSPAPAEGYNILWRVSGSSDAYTNAGLFAGSPAEFFDGTNPNGTQYEGFVRASCGGGLFGASVPWDTSPPFTVSIINNGGGGFVITNVSNIDGFAGTGINVHNGGSSNGYHTKNNSTAICVDLTFAGGSSGHLLLYDDLTQVDCIASIAANGLYCFTTHAYSTTQKITVRLESGAGCPGA